MGYILMPPSLCERLVLPGRFARQRGFMAVGPNLLAPTVASSISIVFHDSAFGTDNSAGTSLGTSDTLAVTAGDLIFVVCKWEQGTGAVSSVTDGTDTYAVASALQDISLPAHTRGFWTTATTTGSRTITFGLDVSRSFRRLAALSFTPTGGTTWTLGNVTQATGATSGSDPFSIGPTAYSEAGVAVCGMGLGGGRTWTAGSGWSVPSEFNGNGAQAEYRILSGSGNVTGDGNFNAGVEYLGSVIIFARS